MEDNRGRRSPQHSRRGVQDDQPGRTGHVRFEKKKGKGAGNQIESYPVGQTIKNLNEQILAKYNEEKEKAKATGKSKAGAENAAQAMAKKLPEFKAVQKWLDTEAEIKLKLAIEKIATDLKIPSLIIRSLSLKAISALTDLGLKLPRDAEIDLLLAYVSGDLLHVAIFEVKRSDTSPWQAKCVPPNMQAVKKAENQLTKDLDILMAILAGIPPSQIIFRTLAAYPDTPSSELCDNIICNGCLETGIICKEHIEDSSLLQKKI